jgi:hypothetical protein
MTDPEYAQLCRYPQATVRSQKSRAVSGEPDDRDVELAGERLGLTRVGCLLNVSRGIPRRDRDIQAGMGRCTRHSVRGFARYAAPP